MRAGEQFPLLIRNGRDFRIPQGSTCTWTIFFDSRLGSNWQGFAARAQLRRNVADKATEVVAEITAKITRRGPAPGKKGRAITFTIAASITEAIRAVGGTWSCDITNGNVTRRVVATSPWELDQTAVRAA
jgi:hypothetical protein